MLKALASQKNIQSPLNPQSLKDNEDFLCSQGKGDFLLEVYYEI